MLTWPALIPDHFMHPKVVRLTLLLRAKVPVAPIVRCAGGGLLSFKDRDGCDIHSLHLNKASAVEPS